MKMVGLTPTLTLFRNLICQFWIKMISEQFFSSENMQITQTVTVFFFTRKPPAVLLQSWRTHKPITQIVISLDIMFLFCALCSFCLVITVRQCSPNKGITVVFSFIFMLMTITASVELLFFTLFLVEVTSTLFCVRPDFQKEFLSKSLDFKNLRVYEVLFFYQSFMVIHYISFEPTSLLLCY